MSSSETGQNCAYVHEIHVLKLIFFHTRKFTNLVMRDGRKLLARELVEEVILLYLETPVDFDVHYVKQGSK